MTLEHRALGRHTNQEKVMYNDLPASTKDIAEMKTRTENMLMISPTQLDLYFRRTASTLGPPVRTVPL